MTRLSTILATLALVAATSVPAFAQTANKTWVSSTSGNDTGTCQFVAPCKTFAYAITQTVAGGELDVKDAGSYGVVTINKAISIVSNGVLAAIAVPQGGTGVTIQVGASDKVVLQGLVIDGHGVGKDGIDFNIGGSLTVENCNIRDFTTYGISVSSSASSLYSISSSEIANAKLAGILISGFNGSSNGALAHLNIHDNNVGVETVSSTHTLIASTVSGNATGLELGSGGTVLLGSTTISANTIYGINNQSGTMNSYGDNYINDNLTDIFGAFGGVTRR